MLGYYDYTVILTYLGALSGVTGITFCLRGNIWAALLCLIISGVCDMFDGAVAATKQRTAPQKRFGVQIDSLSDLICFGVLPGCILYTNTGGMGAGFFITLLYVLCALIRLAWFNVDEEQRQDTCDGSREVYRGLPVTSAALIVPIVAGACRALNLPVVHILPYVMLVTAVLFLTPFRLKKPKTLGKVLVLLLGCGGLVLTLLGVIHG